MKDFNLNDDLRKYDYSMELARQLEELAQKTKDTFLYINLHHMQKCDVKAKFLSHLNYKLIDLYNYHKNPFSDSPYNMSNYLVDVENNNYINIQDIKKILDVNYNKHNTDLVKNHINKTTKNSITVNYTYKPKYYNDIYNTQYVRALINTLSLFNGGELMEFKQVEIIFKEQEEQLKQFRMKFLNFDLEFFLNGNCKIKFNDEKTKEAFLKFINN